MATRGDLPLLKDIKVRREVLEGNYQPAINVADIDRGAAPEFLRDPVEFFKRTAVTDGVKELVVKTLMALLNLREAIVRGTRYTVTSKLFVLPSLFGGGKSHALATVYHVVKVVGESRRPEEAYEKLATLDRDVAGFVKENWDRLAALRPKVVVVHGEYSDYAPTPLDGKPVKTLWGYIAVRLGEYQLMSAYDASLGAPPADVLERVLERKGAVILIDEIAYYYSRIPPTMSGYRASVNAFIMGLSELLGGKEVPSVAVVLTLPYSREKDVVERAHAGLLDASVIKRLVDRTRCEVIRVVAPGDLATVVRRRVFDEDPERLRELGERLARAIVDSVPAQQVKAALAKLREHLPKTYPVHPETIEMLKVLHEYLSEFLQLTRSPIAMIADALRAVRCGCFDWMGFEPRMLMPYHIPVFDEETLVRSLPATERDLYRFKHVLEDSVVKLSPVREKCTVEPVVSRYVAEGYAAPVYAIAVYLWLRSLAGRGWVSHRDIYPKAEDVAYAVVDLPVARDSKWYDAKATLEREVSRLPHVREHEERWFFKWTPRIAELIDRVARDVTPDEVEAKLREGVRSIFESTEQGRIVFTAPGIESMLAFNDPTRATGRYPAVVVFTRPVSDEELIEQVKYNNVVVLAPDAGEKLSPEELKRLEIPRADMVWEALLEVVRYHIACEKLTREDIEREYIEEAMFDKELVNILLKQVNDKRNRYARRAWEELLPRVYRALRLKRGRKLVRVELKQVRREPPGFRVVEDVLLGSYVLSSVDDEWVLRLAERLNMPKDGPGGVSLNSIWQYLLTGEDENIPVVSLDWFARNALQPVKRLEYGVIIKDRVHWKRVYGSRDAAIQSVRGAGVDSLDEESFSTMVREVAKSIERGEEVRLVHYRHIWERWAEQVSGELKDEILVLTNGSADRVLDVKQLRGKPLAEDIVKSYAVYREKPRVSVSIKYPEQVEPGARFTVTVSATSQYVASTKLKVSVVGARPDSVEVPVSLPHEEVLGLEHDGSAGEVRVSVVAEDAQTGRVLGRGEATITVRKPRVEGAPERICVTAREARALVEKGVRVGSVEELEITQLGDFNLALHVVRELGGEVRVEARFNKVSIASTDSLTVDEATELVDSLFRLKDVFDLTELDIKVRVAEESRKCVDVAKELPDGVRLCLEVWRAER